MVYEKRLTTIHEVLLMVVIAQWEFLGTLCHTQVDMSEYSTHANVSCLTEQ